MSIKYIIKQIYEINGEIFNNILDAENYKNMLMNEDNMYQENLNRIKYAQSMREFEIKHEYDQNNTPYNSCVCNRFTNEVKNCLVHMCTCDLLSDRYLEKKYDHYICQQHKNELFRNRGCYHCNYTDCSHFWC